MNRKNIAGWLLLVALGLSQTALSQAAVSARATIRLATEGSYPPYSATAPDGTLSGFEIELARELCNRLNVTCKWVVQNLSGAIPALQNGRFDAIMSCVSITDERKKVVDFSVPYFSGYTTFVAGAKSKYARQAPASDRLVLSGMSTPDRQRLEQLRGSLDRARVGVESASTHEAFLRKFFAKQVSMRVYASDTEMFLDLANGRVDAALSGSRNVQQFIDQQAQRGRKFVQFGPQLGGDVLGTGIGFVFRKDQSALRQQFDAAIMAATADGTIGKLSRKWFGFDGSVKTPSAP